MIVCTKCNHTNADDDTFCQSCGAFLAWDGKRIEEPAPPPPPEPEPEVETDPSKPGFIQRVKAAVIDNEGTPLPPPPHAPADRSSGGLGVPAPIGFAPPPTEGAGAVGAATAEGFAPTATPTPPPTPPPGWSPAPTTPAPPVATPAPGAPATPAPPPSQPLAPPPPQGITYAPPPAAPTPPPATPTPPPVAQTPPPAGPTPPPAAPTPPPAAPTPPPVAQTPPPTPSAAETPASVPPAAPSVPPVPIVPPPTPSIEVAPSAKAAQEARLNAERARRAQAERERREEEQKREAADAEAERAAFAERQRRAAALLDQGMPVPTPSPGSVVPTPGATGEQNRWGPAPSQSGAPAVASSPGQLPGAVQAKRVAPRANTADHAPRPGDLVCGSCGAGNDPDRKFCRQCGTSLVEAAVAAKLPWWKGVLAKIRRQPQRQQPGRPGQPSQRTKRRRAQRKVASYVRIALGIILTVGMIVGIGVPSVRGSVQDYYTCRSRQLRSFLKPENKPVRPQSAKASQALEGFPAGYLIDGGNNTFWQSPPTAPNRGALSVFTIEFGRPVTVRQVIMTPGLPAKDGKFVTQPSPAKVQLAWDGDGTKTDTLQLDQAPGAQNRKLSKVRKDVSSVVVTVTETFTNTPAPGKENQLAMTEIEFFGSPGVGSNDVVTVPKTVVPPPPGQEPAPPPRAPVQKKGCSLI